MDDFALPVPPPLRYRSHEPVLTSAWTRVEEFTANSPRSTLEEEDEEWEEEEVEYVTLDFGSHLPKQVLEDASSFQLLAAESPTPFLRIGNLYFQGRHETSIGTDILLRPARNNAGNDRGEVGEGEEKEEGGMEVFTTTGSHRIVFHPVSIDYARKLPDLLREGSGMGSMVEEGLAGEGSTENLPIASGSGSLGFGNGAGGSAASGSATGMTSASQELIEAGEGGPETLAEGNGGEEVEMQQ